MTSTRNKKVVTLALSLTLMGSAPNVLTIPQAFAQSDAAVQAAEQSTAQARTYKIPNSNRGEDLNQLKFTGGWSHGGDSYTNEKDAYFELTFTGKQVQLYGAKDKAHGIAAISIDGGPETMVDLYASARANQIYFTSPELPSGTHTVKVRVTGDKNPQSQNSYVVMENAQIVVDSSFMSLSGPSGMVSGSENAFELSYIGNLDQILPNSAVIQYDPSKFEVIGAASLQNGVIVGPIEHLDNGKVKLVFSSNQPISAGIKTPIVNLKLKTKDSVTSSSSIALTNLSVTTIEGQEVEITQPSIKKVDIFETEEITLDRSTLSLKAGGFDLIDLNWTPASVLNPNIHWVSSDNSIVKVEPYPNAAKRFKVTGLKAGKATITALSSNEKSQKTIEVEVSNSMDVNRDGYLTKEDMHLTGQLSGSQTGDHKWEQSSKADINGDGKVNGQDVKLIQEELKEHNDIPYKHVFIIGLDGAGNFVQHANAPRMKQFFSEGAVTFHAKTEDYSSSAPSWGAMLHGVGFNTHKEDNATIGNPFAENVPYPSFFKLLKQERPAAKMAAMMNWNPIYNGLIERSADVYNESAGDNAITQKIAEYVKTKGKNTQITFIQLDDIDGAGHSHDYGSAKYYEQYEKTDKNVGIILDAIEEAGLMEDSLIIMSTDHGGHNYTHATTDPLDTTIFWAAKGKGIEPGTVITDAVQIKDTAAVVAKALRLDAPAAWEGKVPEGLFQEKNNNGLGN
ncbi:alkaline phosphatase family protein [Paenibacillus spongiae]|uniref:Alkaline phosphatase family protein n=1 Tax=Paenibacillus spongiae TaxID=2909671 RepID=A0ABY5SIW8_9BACL|nr:alkaline phosphatase family protein [Paenibacillus spongiae]UVI32620.1 alkaline phosphatase family protein [Paenibacillus spongiae]